MEHFQQLTRLARLAANICDAHSCFIFLPQIENLVACTADSSQRKTIQLCAYHSLSQEIFANCALLVGKGLIGWVARHGQPIHVSPFERDCSVLGTYSEEMNLKSFMGIPVELSGLNSHGTFGVIACDSKKAYAFTKLQGKLLSDIAEQISHSLGLYQKLSQELTQKPTWAEFLKQATVLAEKSGASAIEILRRRPANFSYLEEKIGTGRTIALCDQVFKLIDQCLPESSPRLVLPQGDMLVFLDSMMTPFCVNKIRSISEHVSTSGEHLEISFIRASAQEIKKRTFTLHELIQATVPTVSTKGSPKQESFEEVLPYERHWA
ncbi:MAG: GAF domain-containing protein [Bdellovibrionales bacterium]|nr:GAF domain-containing protein [Bdellovibrionales bacterium]